MISLFNRTITKAPQTGVDSDSGNATYGSNTDIKARYEPGFRRDESSHPDQSLEADFVTPDDISEDDIVWPPGADTSDVSEAREVDTLREAKLPGSGQTIIEVRLK